MSEDTKYHEQDEPPNIRGFSAFDLDRLESELTAVTEQRDRLAEAQNLLKQCLSATQSGRGSERKQTMRYEIKTIHDDYDCETCGASYAEGYQIYRDGELIHEMKPVAHCYGGDNFNTEDWAMWIIRDLGHDVCIDGCEAALAAVEGGKS